MKNLLFVIAACFMLVCCNEVPENPKDRRAMDMSPSDYKKELVMDAGRFFVIRLPQEYYELRSTKIIVDRETRVQYLMEPSLTSQSLTVPVDSTGKPLLYNGEFPK